MKPANTPKTGNDLAVQCATAELTMARVGDYPHLDALIYSVCDASGQCATGELTVAVLGDG